MPAKKSFGLLFTKSKMTELTRVIAYMSRRLSKLEQNYDTHKLEFLALKWSITDHFHEYQYGSKFDIYMDNNPLTYILTTVKLDATEQRWIAALVQYHFCLHCKKGKSNVKWMLYFKYPGKRMMVMFPLLMKPPQEQSQTQVSQAIEQYSNPMGCTSINNPSTPTTNKSMVEAYVSNKVSVKVPDMMTNLQW